MTEAEKRQAERDARELGLLLLLLFRRSDGTPIGTRVTFDAPTGTFKVDGKQIPIERIIEYLIRIDERFAKDLTDLTLDLEAGKISFETWRASFESKIKSAHILAAALAIGGVAAAIKSARLEAIIDEQLDYLSGFVEAMRSNRAGSWGMIRRRARSYMRVARVTYYDMQFDLVKAIGIMQESKRILSTAEHCAHDPIRDTPGCVELAQRGWVPIDEQIPLGRATCGPYCLCTIIYR